MPYRWIVEPYYVARTMVLGIAFASRCLNCLKLLLVCWVALWWHTCGSNRWVTAVDKTAVGYPSLRGSFPRATRADCEFVD